MNYKSNEKNIKTDLFLNLTFQEKTDLALWEHENSFVKNFNKKIKNKKIYLQRNKYIDDIR
jgi:hypothetical protein